MDFVLAGPSGKLLLALASHCLGLKTKTMKIPQIAQKPN
jgi:hypothetical protein